MLLRQLTLFASAIGALFVTSCASTTTVVDPGPPAPVIEYVRHQEILTPLPMRVSLPAASGAEHVVVLVRTWGTRSWRTMELARRGQTWSGEVSCREVSTVTGDTRYFFVALDADGNSVGGSGSADWPHVATVVGSLPDGAQALSGGSIPMRCHDPADCPPDFPGCPAYAVRRISCRAHSDCPETQGCDWDGYCNTAPMTELNTATPGTEESEEAELEAAVRSVRQRYRKTASSSSKRTTQ